MSPSREAPGTTATHRGRSSLAFAVLTLHLFLSSCMRVGPDYVRPDAPFGEEWRDPEDTAVQREAADYSIWWTVFDDPVLGNLVQLAYEQNPSLQAAGLRVVEAQARRGIAASNLYPQLQEAFGAYTRADLSENRANQDNPLLSREFDDWQVGFDASWELDIWGRFRRGIEAADAELLASVADYDDVLVTLVAEVAFTYTRIRTLQEALSVAERNVALQQRSYEIASAKFRNGMVTELDVAQALSLLRDTEANIPALRAGIRRGENNLSVLLGVPPRGLQDLLGDGGQIPKAAAEVAVGIPAELLRRRPDVRRAERDLAAQSARIGIAAADLYPRLSLIGSISVTAEDFSDLFEGRSMEAFGGPSFRWAILNYGRIRNNIRVQDARYQQRVASYENTVLRAQQEVENAIAGYLGSLRQVDALQESVAASERAVTLSNLQYREGTTDYVRVLNAQQFLLGEEDRLVRTRGDVALGLVALYKALGGGWELRRGRDFVSTYVAEEMRKRTHWGPLLDSEGRAQDVQDAAQRAETGRAPWRSWLPRR